MTVDPRARVCAENNADYYELLFDAHGIVYQRDESFLFTRQQPPPYMSNMVTLDPSATDIQMDRTNALREEQEDGFGLKDGFCKFDLANAGFKLLFEAQWVWASADTFAPRETPGWRRIADKQDLEQWEDAWKRFGSPTPEKIFPESLLSRDDIAFFGLPDSEVFSAGFIANRSAGAVGLSNVFAAEEPGRALFESAGAIIAGFSPGVPIVGYDHGDVLDEMVSAGFETVGPLRIWVCDSAGEPDPV